MSHLLSERGAAAEASRSIPWRYAKGQTYDPVHNKSGLIAFANAENTLITGDALKFIQDNVDLEAVSLRYASLSIDGLRFAWALADHLNEYLHPHEPLRSDMIQLTSAATAMHDILAWALADPGDGILVSRPIYGRLELDFGNKSQVQVVYADTDAETCFDSDVVESYEKALMRAEFEGVKIRALFIINPNNPLGKCYPKETIIRLMEFCQKHRIHLISDEIYACSVFDSGEETAIPFSSVLSVDSTNIIDKELLHITYGLSKDFGAPGLRIGAIASRNKKVLSAIESIQRFHSPSGPSLAIGAAMLEDGPWRHSFIDSMRTKLAKAYKHVTKGLRDIGVEYLAGGNAGFFVYIDLSPYLPTDLEGETSAEYALARKLIAAGVFLHPGEEHCLKPGWFRLVYTQDEAIVTEGLKRIQTAIMGLAKTS